MRRNKGIAKAAERIERWQCATISAMPLVEIYNQKRVLIEHHNGIESYGNTDIQIKTRNGRITVKGNHLQMIKICKEKLVITGEIHAVSFGRSGNHGKHP